MSKKIITSAAIAAILLLLVAIPMLLLSPCTAETDREVKTFKSNVSGGLERTVTVYDNNGKPIKEYTGKIDVKTNQYGNKVLFDLNDKRIIIYNATVIVEEN